MKRSTVMIILPAMLSMTGCFVSSLHPFFKNQDKFYDPAMVGQWIDGDSSIWSIMPNNVSESFMGPEKWDSTYHITYYEDEDNKAVLIGTLFQLNGVAYVDFYPDPDEDFWPTDMTSFHHIPAHTLARVQHNNDSLLLYWYGQEWLNDLFEQNRIRIKHETVDIPNNPRHILTADTDELQKFIEKFANDPKTVKDIDQIFARGYTDDQEEYGVFLKLKPYHGKIPE